MKYTTQSTVSLISLLATGACASLEPMESTQNSDGEINECSTYVRESGADFLSFDEHRFLNLLPTWLSKRAEERENTDNGIQIAVGSEIQVDYSFKRVKDLLLKSEPEILERRIATNKGCTIITYENNVREFFCAQNGVLTETRLEYDDLDENETYFWRQLSDESGSEGSLIDSFGTFITNANGMPDNEYEVHDNNLVEYIDENNDQKLDFLVHHYFTFDFFQGDDEKRCIKTGTKEIRRRNESDEQIIITVSHENLDGPSCHAHDEAMFRMGFSYGCE